VSSRWTHPVCDVCWANISGGDPNPVALTDPSEKACCVCGDKTISGIYVRLDPSKTLCKGIHSDSTESDS
jgi:hypothetical protein